MGCCW